MQRYLTDEPVQACPPSAWYRFRKFARRKKGVMLAATLITVALVLAIVVLMISNVVVHWERDQKAIALQEKRRNLYVAHMNLAQTHWENANVNRVEELLELYRRVEPGQEDLRGWEWYYQERLCRAHLRTLRGHESSIWSLTFSPDGSRVVTCSIDQMVKVWDVATGQERHTFQGSKDRVRRLCIAFSPDGTRVATSSEDGTLKFDGMSRAAATIGEDYEDYMLKPDGTRVEIGSEDYTLKLWDVATGRELHTFHGNKVPVIGLAFSGDGKRLAASSIMGLTVWEVASGEKLRRFLPTGSVALSPDGTSMATIEAIYSPTYSGSIRRSISADFGITLWDVKSGQVFRKFRGHDPRIIAFSPDGTRLASGGFDNTVKLWDVSSGQELHTFRGHSNSVTTVAFSPDGTRLASGSTDQTVKVWDVASDQEFRTVHGQSNASFCPAFSPDGTRLVSGTYKSATVLDVASGMVLRTLRGGVNCVAFSPVIVTT